jgi:hypothetical protein
VGLHSFGSDSFEPVQWRTSRWLKQEMIFRRASGSRWQVEDISSYRECLREWEERLLLRRYLPILSGEVDLMHAREATCASNNPLLHRSNTRSIPI